MNLIKNHKKELIQQACLFQKRAYAPYSKYHVGAAILLTDGTIVGGCNVENCSYGACICAERSAAVAAVSQGYKHFEAIAIATDSTPPASPCGICRQFLSEFNANLPIFLTSNGLISELSLTELLPQQFDKNFLS